MKAKLRQWLVLILVIPFLVLIGHVVHDNSIRGKHLDITDDFSVYVDDSSLAKIDDPPSREFIDKIDGSKDKLMVGSRKKTIWYLSKIPASTGKDERILEITFPLIEYINVWFYEDGELKKSYRSGYQRQRQHRPIKSSSFAFPVYDSTKEVEVVIAIKTSSLLNFDFQLWDRHEWNQFETSHRVWQGFILGVAMVLIGYNLVIGISLHNVSYVYYVFFALFMTASLMKISGTMGELAFKPRHARIVDFFVFGDVLFSILFANHFLAAKSWAGKIVNLSYILPCIVLFIAVLGYFSITSPLLTMISPLLVILSFGYISYLAGSAYLRGIKRARFVLLSYSTLFIGTLFYFTVQIGLLGKGVATHIVEITAMLSTALLSMALSDHINLIHTEKITADKRLLEMQKDFTKVVMTTQEQEREKISAVLHDGVGHALLILRGKFNKVLEKKAQMEKANETAEDVIDFIDEKTASIKSDFNKLIERTRNLSHELHPHILKRLGLKAAIESTLSKAFAESDVDWYLEADLLADKPSPCAGVNSGYCVTFANSRIHFCNEEGEIIVYRIIQEAINNILKYAKANEVLLRFYIERGILILEIKDDGVGFLYDADKISAGMSIMEGRIQLLGGWMDVETTINQGVTLRFGVPIYAE